MSETSSGNVFDEIEEIDFDQRKVDKEESNFASNSWHSKNKADIVKVKHLLIFSSK